MNIKHLPLAKPIILNGCGFNSVLANDDDRLHAYVIDQELASRIELCVNAMAGIGEDNALFFPGNSVRSVIVSMKTKQLELEQQRDKLLAELDSIIKQSKDQSDPYGVWLNSAIEHAEAVVAEVKGGAL